MLRLVFVFITACLLHQLSCNAFLMSSEYDRMIEQDYRSKAGSAPHSSTGAPFDGTWPKRGSQLTPEERTIADGEIPQYVVDHCPLLHLYSEEIYMPGDIKDFVQHFEVQDSNGAVVKDGPLAVSVDFNDLMGAASRSMYFTALDDFSKNPKWLLGHQPDYGTGYIPNGPAVLIVADKGNGWVDAYWLYFYPFNLGPFIMGTGPWGSHVGDWEHSLVRFWKGEPQYLWMSAHGGGGGYLYSAIEKKDHWKVVNGRIEKSVVKRPLIFSAMGTHANYASMGQHAHDIPFFFNPLSDFTDRGPLWDPSMNFYSYTYNGTSVTPHSTVEKDIGTDWLYYEGHWGDKRLPWSDSRQRWCIVQWRYIDGPTGPLQKNLDRTALCQRSKWWNFWHGCTVRRMIKSGQGLDAERNDLVGDNCGVALYKIRPKWLRSILRIVTWKGVFCMIMDYFTG